MSERPSHPIVDAVEREAGLGPLGAMHRWLVDTPPAMLFVHGILLMIRSGAIAVFLAFIGGVMNFGGNFSPLRVGTGPGVFVDVDGDPDRLAGLRLLVSALLSPVAFFAGLLGGLIPMWASARLIADALRDRSPGRPREKAP
ncbi:MAG: hypothetical protein AAFP26_09155 [Planctomycetota bacterium]